MKFKAINKNTEKYGFPMEVDYNSPIFHGHQKGIAICLMNMQTKQVERNYLSESLGDEQTRDFLLGELLNESKAVLIENPITQFDENNNLVPKIIYLMPYYVAEHSRFKPTVIYNNISNACNVWYEAQVEIIFSEDGLCRYLTVPLKTQNVPVLESIYDMFDCDADLEDIGIVWDEDSEEEGYVLDFYNEAGDRFNLVFSDASELRNAIVSMRLIDIVRHIDEEENDGNKSTESQECS